MLVERRVLQGGGKEISIVSTFPEQCLVPESSALHSLIQTRRTRQRIENGVELPQLAGELVMTGIGHLSGVRARPSEAHLVGQQLSSAVSMLEAQPDALGVEIIGKRTIGALNRVIAGRKISGSAILAAKRAQFELSLNKVNTRTKLVHLGARSRQSGLFTDVVPLLREVSMGDDVPRSFFNHNPALLANTFSVVGKFGADNGNIRQISLGVRKASMSSSPHSRIVAQAAALQSSRDGSSQLNPRDRHNYPFAVELLMDYVSDNIDLAGVPVNVQVGIEKARQLVLATSIPRTASRRQ